MGEEKIYRIIPTLAYKCADNRTKRTLEGFLNAIFDYNPKLDVPKWHEISYSFANPKRENGKLVDFDNFILTDRQLKAIKFTGRKLKDRAIFEHEIDLSEKVDSEMEDKLEKTKSIIEDINSNKYPELDKKGVFKFHCLNKVFKVETTVKMAMLISSRFKTDNIDFKPYDRKRNDTFIKDVLERDER